ncbi:MAG TPA: hypothetical protein VKU01_06175 [Bryobacteraceae bacterium]|nr:hypothetical protein [Bryobacteraceae bacterium]
MNTDFVARLNTPAKRDAEPEISVAKRQVLRRVLEFIQRFDRDPLCVQHEKEDLRNFEEQCSKVAQAVSPAHAALKGFCHGLLG